jgi:glycerophosphoryl diester phosphodiesterase
MTPAWPYPRIVAHRGGGALAPENTLAAFEVGAQYGVKMAELDAKLSADDVVFLLHDDTVDRTSNGHGSAAKLPYHSIAGLDAGSWFGPRFAGERMPTLAEVAKSVERLGMDANIEIKPSPGRERRTGEHVAREAAACWRGRTPPLLSSFSDEALASARAAAPHLPRGLLLDRIMPDWRERAERLACLSIHVEHHALDSAVVRAIKAAGFCLMAYTVNDLARAQRLAWWGVDAICTDRIDSIGPDALGGRP